MAHLVHPSKPLVSPPLTTLNNSSLEGDAGDDTLVDGAGSNTLVGGRGNDLLQGNGGNDTYIFDARSGHDVVDDLSGQNIFRVDAHARDINGLKLSYDDVNDVLVHAAGFA
jgi:trimeric autotransporter adhesin